LFQYQDDVSDQSYMSTHRLLFDDVSD
jgi:hypothetical protein